MIRQPYADLARGKNRLTLLAKKAILGSRAANQSASDHVGRVNCHANLFSWVGVGAQDVHDKY